ncbi:MAG: prepilin-type N-terminal cleavage/methylation domain-containing protein [Gloeomargarita sp. SKYBB_i_bin120]|nr:prepilin-type N-terminal cleavage/methylation domain-containing protein [Gloeomargarita sp. SKYB120]MDW8178917.1 prepilin-type N-terminal cleavage/methylation domain-containing protein [Gloeomargarita sp. SKYBB_i_bin120]
MRPKQLQIQSGGFSLIEVVVATAIIGLTAALIPPIVALSVAARAQSQRVEQAYFLAQGYIDLVRLRMERGPAGGSVSDFINDINRIVPPNSATSLDAVPPPAANALRNAPLCDLRNPNPNAGLCRIDINADGRPDFGTQAFRVRQQLASDGRPIAFVFGVRVYPRAVVQGTYTGPLGIRPAAVRLGAIEAVSNPLAVQYGRVFMPDAPDSLLNLCLVLGGDQARCRQ